MSQINSSDLTSKNSSIAEEEDIIANLEVLLNYDSLEQVDSWEVLMDMADIGSLSDSEDLEDEGGN